MTSYNARVELDSRTLDADVLDGFDLYHPAAGRSLFGRVELVLTVPADSLAQAIDLVQALVARAGRSIVALEVMLTEEFDARDGMTPVPELIGVVDAAAMMKVSRQRVLQRVTGGTLAGIKVGDTWVIPRAAVLPFVPAEDEEPAAV
jgi:hypothetical protein